MWEREFITEVIADAVLLTTSLLIITIYSYLVLGSFSPVHFRSLTAMVGISCVILSILSGYALAFWIGQKISGFHQILPFMILGIGVDDMFVIVNSIDQTP